MAIACQGKFKGLNYFNFSYVMGLKDFSLYDLACAIVKVINKIQWETTDDFQASYFSFGSSDFELIPCLVSDLRLSTFPQLFLMFDAPFDFCNRIITIFRDIDGLWYLVVPVPLLLFQAIWRLKLSIVEAQLLPLQQGPYNCFEVMDRG